MASNSKTSSGSTDIPVRLRTRFRRIRRFWATYQWPLVLALLGLSFFFGYIGFEEYFRSFGTESSPLDILYRTIQLATLESGSISGPLSWELELARWMVPLLTAYTALLAVATLFSNQVQLVRLRFFRDHIVICGLGETGTLLTIGFRRQGQEVVAIESDPDNLHVGMCRETGGIVLNGDATEPTMLLKAGVLRASHIVAVCGDDGVNTEVAVAARQLAERRKRGVLTCSLHLVNPQLYELLREQEIAGEPRRLFRMALFNVYRRGADILLGEHPAFDPDLPGDLRPPKLLIIGLGQLGQGLLIRAARAWYDRMKHTSQKMTILVLDRAAVDRTRALESRFSQLSKVCELIPLQFDIRDSAFEEASFLTNVDGETQIDRVFVCLGDHSLGLQAALRIRHNLGQSQIPIVVRMAESSGLAQLIHGEDPGDPIRNIYTFDLLRKTCTPDLVLTGAHELLAQAIHAEYLRSPGATDAADRARVPWDDLPEDLKESNRRQVDHINAYLHAAGYGIKPLTDWDAANFQFTPEEVERMARLEHARWVEERARLGWRYDPGLKDAEKKTHPYLVEWDSLPVAAKAENLQRIEQLPAALASGGFEVFRLLQSAAEIAAQERFS